MYLPGCDIFEPKNSKNETFGPAILLEKWIGIGLIKPVDILPFTHSLK